MYILDTTTESLADWIRSEIEVNEVIPSGSSGANVRRVQEWLHLRGYGVAIDGYFGPATTDAVANFQGDNGLPKTGEVDPDTFALLVEPMKAALRQQLQASVPLNQAVVRFAQAHLKQHPLEVGGQNSGPWVRLYMRGNEGEEWRWCAGFVSFVVHQAIESLNAAKPFEMSPAVDTLVANAKSANLYVSGEDAFARGLTLAGSIFVVRRTTTDWTHTGFVTAANELSLNTIEANTNDSGSSDGYELCRRLRSYANKDFILLS